MVVRIDGGLRGKCIVRLRVVVRILDRVNLKKKIFFYWERLN